MERVPSALFTALGKKLGHFWESDLRLFYAFVLGGSLP